MTARIQDGTDSAAALYVAFELGWSKWLLGFSVGLGQPARRIEVHARDLGRVSEEIAKGKRRFGLQATAPGCIAGWSRTASPITSSTPPRLKSIVATDAPRAIGSTSKSCSRC